jgi:hypothetical protein
MVAVNRFTEGENKGSCRFDGENLAKDVARALTEAWGG